MKHMLTHRLESEPAPAGRLPRRRWLRTAALVAVIVLIALAALAVPAADTHAQAPPLTKLRLLDGSASAQDFGDTFSKVETVAIGPGFRAVNVQLAGWSLRFANGEHPVEAVSVRITNAVYDPANGTVTFRISGVYRDKNGDDDYVWSVNYAVLALGF